MNLRRGAFAAAIGESLQTVAGVYSRPGRAPREPGPMQADRGGQNRFVWADALAWRATRHLCRLGFEWEEAAKIVHREQTGDWASERDDCVGLYLGVWQIEDQPGYAAWHGTRADILEMIEHDEVRYGRVNSVRLLSLAAVVEVAVDVAALNGFGPASDTDRDRGFIELPDSTGAL